MRIFITGGNGFIGSRVVPLLKQKHAVQTLKHRLHELTKIEKDLKRFKPDVVIHLAWEGLPNIDPEISSKNLREGLQFFELVGKLKIPKLIATGSAWEYDADERHHPIQAAKKTLHVFGKAIQASHGGVFVWAIPFYVYGEGKKNVSLIPHLLEEAGAGKTPTPKNPDAWHDFIYIDDVASAVALLAVKKVTTSTFDVGSGTLTRTGEIAKVIASVFKVKPLKLRPSKRTGFYANIAPLKKLGWKPKTSIREGITKLTHHG